MLSLFSSLYGKIADARNRLYDSGVFESHDLAARVISIGNIPTGGTGKTPLVAYIANVLAERGEKVCVLTRGYGRKDPMNRVLVSDGENILATATESGDEPLELANELLGKASVIADADRVAAAEWAKRRFGVTVFVLDDGFQHRKAKRDVDIVCIDATNPFGGGKMLPAGRLREPLHNLSRADVIVITRADLVEDISNLKFEISKWAPDAVVFVARNKIERLVKLEEFHANTNQAKKATSETNAFAIRECLAHSESLSHAHRAEQELAKARALGDYQNYSRALFGYEEAYAHWNENDRAQAGIRTARLAYASAAYEKGDFDLAAGLLDHTLPEHVALGEQIRKAQEEREARKIRLRRAKRFVAALGAAVFLIAGVAYFGIRAQRDRALDAEEQAQVERDKAIDAEKLAVVEAERARKAEGVAVDEAEKARTAAGVGGVARDEAVRSKAAEEYAAYGARIGLAAARIDENAFASASELLDTCPPAPRGWEWGRLKYLCDRSKLTVNVGAPLNGVALDAERKRVAVGGWNGALRTFDLPDGTASGSFLIG